MPTLDVLNTLKSRINQLGDEPRLLAERGETMSDVAPPEDAVDSDLESLLADESLAAGTMDELLDTYTDSEPGISESDLSAPADDDFNLDDLIESVADETPESPAAAVDDIPGPDDFAGPDDVPGLDDLAGLDDITGLDDLTGPDEVVGLDDLAGPDDVAGLDDLAGPDDVSGLESPAVPEEAAGVEETGEPDFLSGLEDLGGLEDDGAVPAEIGDIGDAGDGSAEAELLSGLGDMAGMEEPGGIGEFDVPDDLETPGEPDETGEIDDLAGLDAFMEPEAAVSPADDLSFDDLDFGDALEEAPGEAVPAGEEAPAEETADEESAEDEGFSLDEFSLDDDFELPGEGPEEPAESASEPAAAAPGETAGDADELGSLEDLELDAGDFSDTGFSEDEFSLDDISADESSDEEIAGLEDLGSFEEAEAGDEGEIPDIEAAVESLGDVDAMDEGPADELSLDDDLNFEEELGADVLSDIQEAGEDSNQFSMDDFGDQYNFKEGDGGYADNLGVDLEQLEQSLDEASEDEKKPFGLDPEELNDILRTLSTLPRNLKIAIEELLADERRNIDDLKPLLDGLLEGDTPRGLAGQFQKITRRKIELPRTYEKRSGRELEARRASLTYRLVREGWPIIRTVFLIIAITWMVGAAGFMWIYRPWYAEKLYNEGLDAIAMDDVNRAVELFYDAWDGWPLIAAPEGGDRIADSRLIVKGWKAPDKWLEYARTLRRRKHWDAADQFYAGYLSVDPGARDVRLEYAEFLSSILGRYENAIGVLDGAPLTGRGRPERDYMLAAGDVYLRWAEDDPTKYEDARFRYAKVLETSRNDEKAILSMMRYHLRIGNDTEVETLLPIFSSEVPGQTREPQLAAEVFAGLAEWQLNRNRDTEARRFLDLALAADYSAPEPHYIDARFWRNSRPDELKEFEALTRTLVALEGRESMSRDELEMRILTLGGVGRIHFARSSRLNNSANPDPRAAAEARSLATGSYTKALELYEDARSRNQLGASPRFGSLYLELGDVLFTGAADPSDLHYTLADTPESITVESDRFAELANAERFYNEAEALFNRGGGGSRLPDSALYRRGYTRNLIGIDGDLVDFHRVVRRRPDDFEARLALAGTLLESGDYEASRSQYARAIELLDDELRRTGGFLNPIERQDHEELLIRYIVAWNNLGVGRARSAARGGGDADYGAALTAFTMASEYFDQVYSIPEMENLGMRGVVSTRDDDEKRITSIENNRMVLAEQKTKPYLNRLTLLGLEKAEDAAGVYHMYRDIPSDLRF